MWSYFTCTLALFAGLLTCHLAQAQTKAGPDSLRRALALARPDTNRVKILLELGGHYQNRQIDSSARYHQQALDLSQQLSYRLGRAQAQVGLAYARFGQGQFKPAIGLLEQAAATFAQLGRCQARGSAVNDLANMYIYLADLPKATQMHQQALGIRRACGDARGVVASTSNLGYLLKEQGKYREAADYYFQALRQAEQIQFQQGIQQQLLNLGVVFWRIKDYPQALNYYQQSLAVQKKRDDRATQAITLDMIAILYAEQGQVRQALDMSTQAAEIYRASGETLQLAINLGSRGEYALQLGEYATAKQMLAQSLALSQQMGNQKNLASEYLSLGKCYTKLGQPDSALLMLKTARQLATQARQPEQVRGADLALSEAHTALGNHQQALAHYQQHIALRDSLDRADRAKEINTLNAQYQTEKKEQQIALLNKQTQVQGLQLERGRLLASSQELQLGRQQTEIEKKDLQNQNQALALANQQADIKTARLENAQKQGQIRALAAANELKSLQVSRRNVALAGAVAVLLLGLGLGYLLYRQRQTQHRAALAQQQARQQAQSVQAVLEAEERERRRIATDLHDGVGQVIMAAKMNLATLDGQWQHPQAPALFTKALALADEAAREVRAISHQMMPAALAHQGLAEALRELAHRTDRPGLAVRLRVQGEPGRLPAPTETALYRMAQELLNNAVKHAQATQIDIELAHQAGAVTLAVTDNGRGLPPHAPASGLGLANLRHRAAYLHGHLELGPAAGQGTRAQVRIPG
jgi:two-component system, NarL family, sensor kinase